MGTQSLNLMSAQVIAGVARRRQEQRRSRLDGLRPLGCRGWRSRPWGPRAAGDAASLHRSCSRYGVRAAEADIDIAIASGQHQTVAGSWQTQNRAAATATQDAKLRIGQAGDPRGHGPCPSLDPLCDVASQVEDAIGRGAGGKATDGNGSTRGSVFCAATITGKVAEVAAIAGKLAPPGIDATIGATSRLFPLKLRRQALADKRAIGRRIGMADPDHRQSPILGRSSRGPTHASRDTGRVGSHRDLCAIDLKGGQRQAPRRPLVLFTLAVAIDELTGGNQYLVDASSPGHRARRQVSDEPDHQQPYSESP